MIKLLSKRLGGGGAAKNGRAILVPPGREVPALLYLRLGFEALPWAGIRRVGEWPQLGTQKKLRMTKPMMDRLGSRAPIPFLCADAVAVAAINRESSRTYDISRAAKQKSAMAAGTTARHPLKLIPFWSDR